MDDLSLLPVSDFGSFQSEKHQAVRIEFTPREDDTPTIVNVLCKTKKKVIEGEEGVYRLEEQRDSVTLDRLLSHMYSLNLRKTNILSIVVLEAREEWKQKIVFSLRKLFFLISDLPIVHLEVGAFHWTVFEELRMDFYSTFKNIHELIFLPDQTPEEGDYKAEKEGYSRTFLAEWLPRVKSTLKCLRVFTFLRVDTALEELLSECAKLKTITIGKLYAYKDNPEFPSISCVDLDGQDMAYSTDELSLAGRARTVFPSARVFRVVRSSVQILKALLHNLIVAGGVFDVYTDLYEVEQLQHIVGDTMDMVVIEAHPVVEEAYIEMMGRNERYRTTIHFLNHRQKRFIE